MLTASPVAEWHDGIETRAMVVVSFFVVVSGDSVLGVVVRSLGYGVRLKGYVWTLEEGMGNMQSE